MRSIITLLILFFMMISCKKEIKENEVEANFKSFVYVYGDMRSYNLIKFTGGDTLFLQRKFPEHNEGNYYAVLPKVNKDWLNAYLNKLDFKKYKSIYESFLMEDGSSEIFIMNRKGLERGVYTHECGPKEFKQLSVWIENLKKNYTFIPTKKEIDFGNPERFSYPPPPPPRVDTSSHKD
jgi:hypothetical protein